MVVLLVLGGLVLVLAAACVWEARTGRPMWSGPDRRPRSELTRATAAAAATVVFLDLGSGGDG